MKRTKKEWEALAKELRSMIGCLNPKMDVTVSLAGDNRGLTIRPAEENDGTSFYFTEEIVDFCRCKKCMNVIIYDKNTNSIEVYIWG